MMKPKIAFFDVDNTLVSHTQHDIPASTLRALYQLQENDIKVFLATGRHYCELDELPMHDFPFDGYVLLTGQLCLDKELNILYHHPFDKEDQKNIVEVFSEKETATMLVNQKDCYINIVNDYIKKISESYTSDTPKIQSYCGEDIYQASLFTDLKDAQRIIQKLPNCKLVSWSDDGFDIISKTGGKTIGIQKICEHYNIDIQDTMAFGDGDNDIDMLKKVGLGICMGNGTKEAKDAADFVTKHIDEDGIAYALQYYKFI